MNSSGAAIFAAAFLAIVAGTSAQAREALSSGFHGNTPTTQVNYQTSDRLYPPDAHSAYAHAHSAVHVHPLVQMTERPSNMLLDKIHGQPAQ